jgi:hypothetical protein
MPYLPKLNVKDRPTSWRKAVKWIKRSTGKKHRRLAKVLLEDAPKIVTKGWMD